MTKPRQRSKSLPSLTDDDAIDRLLQTTCRGKREIYIPTEEPDVYLKLRNRLAVWVLHRRLKGYPDEEVGFGFWPHVTAEAATAHGRRIKASDRAWESRPPPPLPIRDVLSRYETEKLALLPSGQLARRGLRQALGSLLGHNAHTIETTVIAAELAAIATKSPTNANRCRSYIRALFRWAMSQELITTDPTSALPKFVHEGRHRRNLSLEEIAEVWHAAEVLDHPGQLAIRLLILLPISRTELIQLDASRLLVRGDTYFWGRANPIVRDVPWSATLWALPPLACSLIAQTIQQRPAATWLLSESGAAPGVNWTGCKRRIVDEINRGRLAAGRKRQTRWHLDDLQGSFEAIAIATLGAKPTVAARCQDHLHRFRSRAALENALSQSATDEACELLWHWNQLVWAATSHSHR